MKETDRHDHHHDTVRAALSAFESFGHPLRYYPLRPVDSIKWFVSSE